MLSVFIEVRDGKAKKGSLEVLSEAGRLADALGTDVVAAMAGPAPEDAFSEVFAYGASKIYSLENPRLGSYSSQGFAIALGAFAREVRPEALFFAATAMGKDLAPRVAARLGVSMASDCTKTAVKGDAIEFTRPIYAGKALLSVRLKSSPLVATFRPNVFALRPPEGKPGERIAMPVDVPESAVRGLAAGVIIEQGGEIDVTEADIIVSGGRGMKAPENFALLQELSAVLPRSAVGASRSAVDSGWIGHQHQVGQTGKTVSPAVYMAFGISGAIQHLAGISSSKYIVAVNKDPEAPIFKVADYGIVGDLFEVIPPLKEALKKAIAES
ncbi:MAG: electron transfer flavoprotein subunit alpha/FixB family protein [Acidobacteriota bacterium]|nr:electron transfer flavoprotein subunit alpha/FixB family protein [Acidobacteriota bacterium]